VISASFGAFSTESDESCIYTIFAISTASSIIPISSPSVAVSFGTNEIREIAVIAQFVLILRRFSLEELRLKNPPAETIERSLVSEVIIRIVGFVGLVLQSDVFEV
jgi:hypothetical protein